MKKCRLIAKGGPSGASSAYPRVGRKTFLARLEPLLSPRELEYIETAYVFSKYGHRNQMRDGGKIRYFEHPKAVAWILIHELGIVDWRVIVLALLHDIIEDSYILSSHRIEQNFGKQVVVGLKLLTKQPKRGYMERLARYATADVIMVKLGDRLHNLRTLSGCSREKRERQIAETRKKYLPLADAFTARLPKKHRWRGEYLKSEIMKLCAAPKTALGRKA